jgi:quercetin dioxygenase-like cupin family protein
MNTATLYPDWKEIIVYGSDGPQPTVLMANEKAKSLVAGLEPGAKIPDHAESQALYHFLEGTGWMTVDGERLPVKAGSTIVMPQGAVRGLEAETRLAFIAVRIA